MAVFGGNASAAPSWSGWNAPVVCSAGRAGLLMDGRKTRLPAVDSHRQGLRKRRAALTALLQRVHYGQSIFHSVKYSASPQATRSVPDGTAPSSAGRSGSSVTARPRTGSASSRRRIGVRPKSNDGS